MNDQLGTWLVQTTTEWLVVDLDRARVARHPADGDSDDALAWAGSLWAGDPIWTPIMDARPIDRGTRLRLWADPLTYTDTSQVLAARRLDA